MPQTQETQWSPPQTIPLYHPDAAPPILIADQNRTVHAFSSQWVGDEADQGVWAIVYNRWTLEQGWTIPIDIILSPSKEARITDVHLDKKGIFHVVFFGGDNTAANIYYSRAPAVMADDVHSWSTPVAIGENAGDPETAVVAEDDQGTLHVVYSGRALGDGLYEVNSSDGGETWSDSNAIFLTQSDKPIISLLQVIKGESGWFHAIWGVYDRAGQGRGIYYARSKDASEWSEPVLLANPSEGLGSHTPSIIEHSGTVFALYNMPPKITMRRSLDDGKTWDEPTILFPRHVGVNGSISPVIDSNNELHLFFGQRITGSPDIHGMWHSIWTGNRWTEPEALIRGPKVTDMTGNKSFDPNAARAIVIQGNVILVTWRTDPGSKGNGVWYSYKEGFGPELPVIPLPTLTSMISTTSGSEVMPTGNPNPVSPAPTNPIVEHIPIERPIALAPNQVIAISLTIVVLFTLLLLLSILRKRSS